MTRVSRPLIPIDWDRTDELLEAGALGTEIAAYFGMHPETFYDRVRTKYEIGFTQYVAEKKSKGDALIREAQYKKAIRKLDNTMLIWLGKQRLGQKENNGDVVVSADVLKAFDQLMAQIDSAQKERLKENPSDCASLPENQQKPGGQPPPNSSIF